MCYCSRTLSVIETCLIIWWVSKWRAILNTNLTCEINVVSSITIILANLSLLIYITTKSKTIYIASFNSRWVTIYTRNISWVASRGTLWKASSCVHGIIWCTTWCHTTPSSIWIILLELSRYTCKNTNASIYKWWWRASWCAIIYRSC